MSAKELVNASSDITMSFVCQSRATATKGEALGDFGGKFTIALGN